MVIFRASARHPFRAAGNPAARHLLTLEVLMSTASPSTSAIAGRRSACLVPALDPAPKPATWAASPPADLRDHGWGWFCIALCPATIPGR